MQVPPFSLSKQLFELGPALDEAVLRVLHSGQFIGGSEVNHFENSFASFIQVSHAVGCNSGTDALILALRALDIGPGDEVITCSFSFFATAEAISAVGAKPIFVDVDPSNFLIDINLIETAITKSTKAILPVHLFGNAVDMDFVIQLAKQYNLKVIEDCAQACGAEWNKRPVGGWGDVGCFSFFPTKNLGCAGDGGAVTTENAVLAKRMRELAVHGMPRRYVHTHLGYNSRLDAIQAAVLNVKLSKLPEWISRRREIAYKYKESLEGLPGIDLPFTSTSSPKSHGWNQFVIRVRGIVNGLWPHEKQKQDNEFYAFSSSSISQRDILKEKLEGQGVNTIIYYPIPIHLQDAYDYLGYKKGSLPITEKLCEEVLSLPMFPELASREQQYVVDILREIIGDPMDLKGRNIASKE
ncbi:DegT/DnrJ/EryC1/StrS family aminotransferase [Prochlorococcus sp. MIT 1300]|uniref:DegT/DnrJ/EryC1/StrS family aminotransferase n=1 Tax=Prochlorococcus sp. MIT 1300 TaxID=3096218 RepID=UPI002A75FDE3|nr:DegT/DnrJ/EryC1/StrS family aminotransferase [Prochlorococcus sp. MIT 1300]